MITITLYHNASCIPVDEWLCEDDTILDVLGEPVSIHGGSVRYYDVGDGFRLLTTSSNQCNIAVSPSME